jgi:adducin
MMSKQRQVNGGPEASKYIDSIDPDDPEYLRQLRRPAEVKQDVRQMEDRRRVQLVLNSKAFRSELERLVDERIKSGEPCPPSLVALQQQITGLFLPQARLKHGALFTQGNGPVIPVADFKTDEAIAGYAKGEKLLRCKVASAYRLADMFGWAQGTLGLISARVFTDEDHYLAAPANLHYHEVTATNLVKVDRSGAAVHSGSAAQLTPNRTSFTLVSALHAMRPDLKSIIYLCNPAAASVSSMTCGLLPLCQDAMALGEVPFYELEELTSAGDGFSKAIFLKNRGVLVGGETIEEAFHIARRVMNAIDTQLRTVPLGLDNIVIPSAEARRKAFEAANQASSFSGGDGDGTKRRWRAGELEFEALMRRLENAGYRTGYPFHESLVRKVEKHDRVNAEVEVPPTLTSIAFQDDEGSAERVKKPPAGVNWINPSNAYKKEEIELTGAPRTKKITKWVPDDAPAPPIKIENANQFAPIGSDPKELRVKFQEIRKDYYDENIKAGPQSRILEGVTWEEAQKIKEGNVKSDTIIVVGAASRGIIQRDHQGNAAVFKTYYAPNPFDSVTEEDVEQYKAEITKKTTTGEALTTTDDEALSPGPDGRLISTEERMQQVRQQTQSASPPPESTDAYTTDTHTDAEVASPAKSTTSAEIAAGGSTSATSPVPTTAEGTPDKKHKKKRGFRMPSFSSKKKEK